MTNEQARAAVRIAMKKNAGGSLESLIASWMGPMIKDLTRDLEKLTGLKDDVQYNDKVPCRLSLKGQWGERTVTVYVEYSIGDSKGHKDILALVDILGIPKSRNTTFDFGFEMTAEQMQKPVLDWAETVMKTQDEEPKKKPVKR